MDFGYISRALFGLIVWMDVPVFGRHTGHCSTDQLTVELNNSHNGFKCTDCSIHFPCQPGLGWPASCGSTIADGVIIECLPCVLGQTFSSEEDRKACQACQSTKCVTHEIIHGKCDDVEFDNTSCSGVCVHGYTMNSKKRKCESWNNTTSTTHDVLSYKSSLPSTTKHTTSFGSVQDILLICLIVMILFIIVIIIVLIKFRRFRCHSKTGASPDSSKIGSLNQIYYSKVCNELNKSIDEKDWKTVAGEMGYKNEKVSYYAEYKKDNPTHALLQHWETKNGNDVHELIKICKKIGRDDVVKILQVALGIRPRSGVQEESS